MKEYTRNSTNIEYAIGQTELQSICSVILNLQSEHFTTIPLGNKLRICLVANCNQHSQYTVTYLSKLDHTFSIKVMRASSKCSIERSDKAMRELVKVYLTCRHDNFNMEIANWYFVSPDAHVLPPYRKQLFLSKAQIIEYGNMEVDYITFCEKHGVNESTRRALSSCLKEIINN